MLQHFDQARLGKALEDAQRTDTEAVVVAITRDNGQVVIYNIGSTDERRHIYEVIANATRRSLHELNARITLSQEEGKA